MVGRKPTPVEQRLREGGDTISHRPVPEPLLVAGRPDLEEIREPPAHLDPDAQDFWRESVVLLVDVGIIDRVDVPTLELLAQQYAFVRSSLRVLQSEGHYTRGSRGQIRPHPALKIYNEASAQFLKLAEHYALTPIARTRLGLAELHRRTLQQEMSTGLGAPNLRKAAHQAAAVTIDA